MTPKPDFITDEHLKHLDTLDESGHNMFKAVFDMETRFGVSRVEALDILAYWMMSFEERNP